MFGYGSGRPGPTHALLTDLENASKAGNIVLLPYPTRGSVPAAQLEHLKGLYRASVVKAQHAMSAATLLPTVRLPVDGMLLPAEEFVFELEPVETNGVTARVVHVRKSGKGAKTQLEIICYGKLPAAGGWLMTPPCKLVHFDEFSVSSEVSLRRAPPICVLGLSNEIHWAMAGVTVLAALAHADRDDTRD